MGTTCWHRASLPPPRQCTAWAFSERPCLQAYLLACSQVCYQAVTVAQRCPATTAGAQQHVKHLTSIHLCQPKAQPGCIALQPAETFTEIQYIC